MKLWQWLNINFYLFFDIYVFNFIKLQVYFSEQFIICKGLISLSRRFFYAGLELIPNFLICSYCSNNFVNKSMIIAIYFKVVILIQWYILAYNFRFLCFNKCSPTSNNVNNISVLITIGIYSII